MLFFMFILAIVKDQVKMTSYYLVFLKILNSFKVAIKFVELFYFVMFSHVFKAMFDENSCYLAVV